MAAPRKSAEPDKPRRPPAKTPEARENQLIALAVDEAERQIRDGTASAQVLTHFLKLGTSRERLEQEKLRKENILLEAKAEAMASTARIEELYASAIEALRGYSGETIEDADEY